MLLGAVHRASDLASALLATEWQSAELSKRLKQAFQSPPRSRWTVGFVRTLLASYPAPPARTFDLTNWLLAQPALQQRWRELTVVDFPRARMSPHPEAASFQLPELLTSHEVAVWLRCELGSLEGLAGRPVPEPRRGERGRNYRYQWIVSASGRRRLLEIPKDRLKAVQRQILEEVLTKCPPHAAAHAFVRGRGVASCLSPHVGRDWLLRLDLDQFFSRVRGSRVREVFRFLGYPERVVELLTRLCINQTPRDVLEIPEARGSAFSSQRELLRSWHLPQGAPTSPALANLCLFGLDRRLDGIAEFHGVTYTRYCDDLVFSGDAETRRSAGPFRRMVLAILAGEGFPIRQAKTRFMTAASRQSVCGLVLNERLNVPRAAYDHLKAVLHRCSTRGLTPEETIDSEHFRQQLQGRIAWISATNSRRGAKLRELLQSINWPVRDERQL